MKESPSKRQNSGKRASSQVSTRYLIKKALLDKNGNRCSRCYRKTVPVRLFRVHKKSKQRKESDYILLCHDCIIERQEQRKEEKKRLWSRKAARRKITRGGFWNRIRSKILERDGYKCAWCNTDKNLGLCSLIPESRGGKLAFDNFVCTCSYCRPSKGNKLPLEFIFEAIDLDEYLKEQLDEHLRVKGDPGKYVQIRFFLFSQVSEFLHKLTNSKAIPDKMRIKAEQLNIKLLK